MYFPFPAMLCREPEHGLKCAFPNLLTLLLLLAKFVAPVLASGLVAPGVGATVVSLLASGSLLSRFDHIVIGSSCGSTGMLSVSVNR